MIATNAIPKPTPAQSLRLEEFTAYLTERERSIVTIQGYVGDVTLFARWYQAEYGEELSCENLTPAAVRAYKQHLLEQEAKPKTINRRLASLAAYAHWASQAGYLNARNPVAGILKVPQASLAPRWLDSSQKNKLLRTVDDEVETAIRKYPRLQVTSLRDAAIVHLLLNTGLRVREVVGLRRSDLLLTERKGVVIVRQGKGGKRREIPLNAQVRKVLQDYLDARPDVDTDRLFVGQRNHGIQEKTVQRAVKRFAKAAGMGDISAHMLRHTFAKSLIDKGVTLEKVAALLGHSDLSTTQIYTTPGERDLEDAVGRLGG